MLLLKPRSDWRAISLKSGVCVSFFNGCRTHFAACVPSKNKKLTPNARQSEWSLTISHKIYNFWESCYCNYYCWLFTIGIALTTFTKVVNFMTWKWKFKSTPKYVNPFWLSQSNSKGNIPIEYQYYPHKILIENFHIYPINTKIL